MTAWSPDDGGYVNLSERQQAKVDANVQALVEEAADTCRQTLIAQSKSLHDLANQLLTVETVDGEAFQCIMRGEPIPVREPEVEPCEATKKNEDGTSDEEEDGTGGPRQDWVPVPDPFEELRKQQEAFEQLESGVFYM